MGIDPLLGSSGRGQNRFGRRGEVLPRESGSPPVFGRREKPPVRDVSLQRERLRALYCEIRLHFVDRALPDEPLPFTWEEESPAILFGDRARIHCDPVSGGYVFTDGMPGPRAVLTTSSPERMLDCVTSHLAAGPQQIAAITTLGAIEMCVGNRIADMERVLILATLRRFHGNRTHAARQLGISLRTLRNKLRLYWRQIDANDQLLPSDADDVTAKFDRAVNWSGGNPMEPDRNET
jgi:hypothetical protein